MNTFMGRLWVFGGFAGLFYGVYLAVERSGGVTAMAIMPLLGAMAGVLIAMVVDEVKSKWKKRRKKGA
ncbi:MAG: hypothetical protein WEA81_04205 [Dehalococcoidia bacterium]